MNIDKFTITSYDQLTGFDRTTGTLDLILDEISDFTLSHEEEKVDITGRGGRVIGSLKKNKKVTGKGTNGMISGGALAAMIGATVSAGENAVKFTDTILVANSQGTTRETAIGTPGNEIGAIYVRDDKSNAYISDGKKLTQTNGAPTAGTFSYDPNTKTITFFAGDVADGTEVIAFYDAEVNSKKITNDANAYSKTLSVIIDCCCTDACDNVFHGQFLIPRADFSGTFDIAGGSEASTLGFEFTSQPDLCTGKSALWDFIVFD